MTWEPDRFIAKRFSDLAVRAIVRREIIGHADWLELDRETLATQTAIARAAQRTRLAENEVAEFLRQVPTELIAISETVDLLYRLKKFGHALFCLSNMQFASIEYLEKTYTFWEVFTGKAISYRLNLCKPEPAIYAHLLGTYGLQGTHTVFIDDVEVNLAAGAKFGMHTIKFENPAQCELELRALGCIGP